MLKYFRRIKNSHYVILALLTAIFCCTQMCGSRHQTDAGAGIPDSHGEEFAGSASCMSCHREIYKSHIQTAHYHDSGPASASSIKGSFDSGRNRFIYSKSVEVVMEHKNDGFYQTAFQNGKEYDSKPFDLVIGSGRKGQSYLYWGGDQDLFQLPVSYYTPTHSWANSPGFMADYADFKRPVESFCLECHTTFARTFPNSEKPNEDQFDKSQIIYGIDCEKCHGPGKAHEDYHQAHPGETTGKFIINAAKLTRQQSLDACAQCHSGWRFPLTAAFSFKVGDRLNSFSVARNQDSASTLDVHGNQYGLLRSSKCFIQSGMDCSSCHNVHANEAGNLKLYSQRCMTCHTQAAHNTCTMPATPGLVLSANCIDCHMPALTTKKIIVEMSRAASDSIRNVSPLVHTHHIAIYAASTKDYLDRLRSQKMSRSEVSVP